MKFAHGGQFKRRWSIQEAQPSIHGGCVCVLCWQCKLPHMQEQCVPGSVLTQNKACGMRLTSLCTHTHHTLSTQISTMEIKCSSQNHNQSSSTTSSSEPIAIPAWLWEEGERDRIESRKLYWLRYADCPSTRSCWLFHCTPMNFSVDPLFKATSEGRPPCL